MNRPESVTAKRPTGALTMVLPVQIPSTGIPLPIYCKSIQQLIVRELGAERVSNFSVSGSPALNYCLLQFDLQVASPAPAEHVGTEEIQERLL